MLLSALFVCFAIGTYVDAAGISDSLNLSDGILGANLNASAEDGASPSSMNSRKPKLFSNIGGIFGEPFCGPKGTSDLTGVCKNELTCLKENGFPNFLGECTTLQGPCCEFRRTCGGSSGQRLTFWQSTGYPNPLTEPGICTFKLAPANGVCYIKVEFLDLILDSQIAGQCMANTLYILNMADGNGSPICGALTGYETYVKVKPTQTGLTNLLSLPEYVIFLINTKTINTAINPTKFQLRMTQIPCDKVNVFAGRNIESAEEASPVGGSAREGRRKHHRGKTPSTSAPKGPSSPSKKPTQELMNSELLKCLGNSTRISLPPFPINLSFLGNNIFADLIQKIVSKVGLLLPHRVAGGTAITDVKTQYPWLGYVLLKNDFDAPFFCGAVLISPKYALTAAHCVTQKGFSQKKYEMKVRFGRTDISNSKIVDLNDLWKDPLSVMPKRTVVHAMFDSVTLENDIAVLELATPVNLTPVKLPSVNGNYDGKAGKVLGWGYTGVDSGFPRNPQVLDVTVLKNDACDAVWSGLSHAYTYTLPRYIQKTMVCSSATKPPDAGICTGDSGGPLVVEEAGSHTLVGIISGAFFTCVSSGGTGGKIGVLPDVSTRVSEMLGFINVATS